MGTIRSEVLTGFLGVQERFGSSLALTLSEHLEVEVKIPTPTVEALPISALLAHAREPTIQMRFTFAEAPSEPHLLLIGSLREDDSELIPRLVKVLTEGEQAVTDEAVLEVLRPFLDQLLQGLASAATSLRGTPFTLGEVNGVYEPLTLPPSFLQADEVLKVEIPLVLREDEPPLPVSWILEEKGACRILGLPPQDQETEAFLSELASPSPASSLSEVSPGLKSEGGPTPRSLDLLLDIPLEISVELGRVEMTIRDILELGTGSIIELPKAAGEPVEIMVNGRLIARGEVVVVEENFGVRVMEIISPLERVQKLGA